MTEAEWLRGSRLEDMLAYVMGEVRPRGQGLLGWLGFGRKPVSAAPAYQGSPRKLRLFACACCRRIERLFRDERSRQAVEVSERFADGLANEEQLREAADAASAALFDVPGEPVTTPLDVSLKAEVSLVRVWAWAARSALMTARGEIDTAVWAVWEAALEMATGHRDSQWAKQAAGDPVRASLLRDIFGNPFRPVIADPSWLAWNGATVVNLARAIYDEKAFDRLPILADALEDAGCTNADILNHCRQPGVHVRGCWVVDLLLAKE